MSSSPDTLETLATQEYKWGFVTDIEADAIPRGLSEDVVRLISAKKNEPNWLPSILTPSLSPTASWSNIVSHRCRRARSRTAAVENRRSASRAG